MHHEASSAPATEVHHLSRACDADGALGLWAGCGHRHRHQPAPLSRTRRARGPEPRRTGDRTGQPSAAARVGSCTRPRRSGRAIPTGRRRLPRDRAGPLLAPGPTMHTRHVQPAGDPGRRSARRSACQDGANGPAARVVTETEKLTSMRPTGTGPIRLRVRPLVPLELGGAMNDPRNLWPTRRHPEPEGRGRDRSTSMSARSG